MHRFIRSAWGVALWSLFLLSLGFRSGGWFCANGTPCGPVEARHCCCGEAADAESVLTALPCGCYYAASRTEVVASLGAGGELSPALPSFCYRFSSPAATPSAHFRSVPDPVSARHFAFPGDPRGPPRA